MLQRFSPWLAAGLTTGIVILCGLAFAASIFYNTWLLGQRTLPNERLVAAFVNTSLQNQEVQAALKNQVVLYLRSPEGRARLAELMKSPEMVKVMADNIQTPEMRTAVFRLMEVPEFRAAILSSVKDLPELRKLLQLAAAIDIPPDLEIPTAPTRGLVP